MSDYSVSDIRNAIQKATKDINDHTNLMVKDHTTNMAIGCHRMAEEMTRKCDRLVKLIKFFNERAVQERLSASE